MPRPPSAARAFNDKARAYLYSVGTSPRGANRKTDCTDDAHNTAQRIRHLAESFGQAAEVSVTFASDTLTRQGIFFMNAPAKFAAEVRRMDGVHYVDRPAPRNKCAARKPRALAAAR